MGEEFDFGSRDAANAVRDDHGEHLTDAYDRRYSTVEVADDAPEHVVEDIRARVFDSRESENKTPMAGELSESEREAIRDVGGFTQHASTLNWRKAKGVFQREGATDKWRDALGFMADYEDPQEGAEAWIQQARKADATKGTAGASGGARDDGMQGLNADQKAADAARTAMSEHCDHAEKVCRHGDPEACEALQQECGLSEEDVGQIMGSEADDDPGGQTTFEDLTGTQKGALSRAWNGYKAAVGTLDRHLSEVREAFEHAEKAALAIDAIEEQIDDQDTDEFRRLAEHHRTLAQLCEDHSTPNHGQPDVDESDERGPYPEDEALAAREPDRPAVPTKPDDLAKREHEREVLREMASEGHRMRRAREEPDPVIPRQAGPRAEQITEEARIHDHAERMDRQPHRREKRRESFAQVADRDPRVSSGRDDAPEQFAAEKQGTLGVGVEADQVAEEKQVTLTGEDESESPGALPSDWQMGASAEGFEGATKWVAGPYGVAVTGEGPYTVRLSGRGNSFNIATGVRDPQRAVAIADEFTDRVAPDEVNFHSSDATVQQAAADAKRATTNESGGLSQFA